MNQQDSRIDAILDHIYQFNDYGSFQNAKKQLAEFIDHQTTRARIDELDSLYKILMESHVQNDLALLEVEDRLDRLDQLKKEKK